MSNDLKRKSKMLKRNMLGVDKDIVPTYKTKLRSAFYKIKSVCLFIPKEMRKFQGKKL
jgi:hypothetical protein